MRHNLSTQGVNCHEENEKATLVRWLFRNYRVMWFGIGMGFMYNADRLAAVLVEQQIDNTKFK